MCELLTRCFVQIVKSIEEEKQKAEAAKKAAAEAAVSGPRRP